MRIARILDEKNMHHSFHLCPLPLSQQALGAASRRYRGAPWSRAAAGRRQPRRGRRRVRRYCRTAVAAACATAGAGAEAGVCWFRAPRCVLLPDLPLLLCCRARLDLRRPCSAGLNGSPVDRRPGSAGNGQRERAAASHTALRRLPTLVCEVGPRRLGVARRPCSEAVLAGRARSAARLQCTVGCG